MTHIVHHCFCQNNWKEITKKHYRHLQNKTIHCNLIGREEDKNDILELALKNKIELFIKNISINPNDFEHNAIMQVQQLARAHPKDLILYFHSKGSGNPTPKNKKWNNYMTAKILAHHEEIVQRLCSSEKEVAGVLFTKRSKDPILNQKPSNFFAGNFWIAKNSYISTLPDYQTLTEKYPNRFIAERFIGIGNPDVLLIDQNKAFVFKGLFGVNRRINRLPSLFE